MHQLLHTLLRLAKGLLTWLVALLILFEEWGWEPLARLAGQLARLPLVGRIEQRIAQLPPYLALALLALPASLLLPVKLMALWLIEQGRPWLGLAVIVAAKVLGTALVARLFMLTQPALMRLPWFARLFARWTAFKERVKVVVRQSAAWRAARSLKSRARALWKRFE
jgi:hypothetical protein